MGSYFKAAGDRIRNSPAIIVIWLAVTAFALVCAALLWEGYTTSRLGYEMIPTRKANDWVIPLVALIPILGQIVFAYAYLSTGGIRSWAAWVTAILHMVDMGTDVVYKVNGQWSAGLVIVAFLESEVLYTIGAIIGFTFALGTWLEITPDMLHALNDMLHSASVAAGLSEKQNKGGSANAGSGGTGQGNAPDPLGLSGRGNRP